MPTLSFRTVDAVDQMILGTKITTIRRNYSRWNGIYADAVLADKQVLLHIWYTSVSWHQYNPDNPDHLRHKVGVRVLSDMTIKAGSWFNTNDAQRDGFPDVASLIKALGGLNGMMEDEVLHHTWAVLHMGEWVEGPHHIPGGE